MVPAVYRVLSLRYLLHRWDRALLIVVSIALGVATLISARILNQCIEAAAQDTTTPGAAAELYVTNGEAGVLRSLVDELRAANVPGVKSVQPLVYDRVTLPDLDGRVAVLIGAEVTSQLIQKDNPLKVTVEFNNSPARLQLLPVLGAIQEGDFTKAGKLWDKIPARLVMVSRPIYDEWLRRGGGNKPFVVRHAQRDVECLPVGIVDFAPDSPLAPMGKNFIGMSVGQAARVLRPIPPLGVVLGGPGDALAEELGSPEKVNRIDLFLEPGADNDASRARRRPTCRQRASVRTPDAQRRSTQEIVSGLQLAFLVCAAGAMIVGLFLVYNAMAVTVAERRPDIGILRSVGATRGQIVVLFASLATILGVIGAIARRAARHRAGRTHAQPVPERTGVDVPEPGPESDADLVDERGAGGPRGRLDGRVRGARPGGPGRERRPGPRRPPQRRAARKVSGSSIHRLCCLTLLGGGAAMILFRHELPARLGAVGGMMIVLIGLLLVGSDPRRHSRLVPATARCATCPISVRLAFDNLSRAPGRTGVVIGALGAGVALMFQTAGVARSNEEPVVAWIAQVVQADPGSTTSPRRLPERAPRASAP